MRVQITIRINTLAIGMNPNKVKLAEMIMLK